MLARLFVRLVSVPFLIYVAASLGPSLFGVFTFVMATVEMVSSLSDFGLSRYGTRAMVREDMDQARFAGILLTLQLFTSIVLGAIGLVVVLFVDPASPKLEVLLLGLLAVAISAFIYTSETVFTAMKQFAASAIFTVAGRLIYLAAGFVALGMGWSVVAIMWAFVASMVLESAIRMVYVALRVTPFSFRFHWPDVKTIAIGTLPFAATAISSLVYFRADTIILEVLKGDTAVGIYGAAYSFFSFFMWFPIVLSRALLPSLTAGFRDDPEEARLTSWYWYRATGVAGVAIAFATTVLAAPVITTLMGDAYAESIPTLQILIWTIPPLMMVSMSFNSLTVCDREKTGANTSVMSAITIVALDFALIPFFGTLGAAAAMVITTTLWEAWMHWLLVKHLLAPRNAMVKTFSMPFIGGALMAAAAITARPLGIAATLVAGLMVYAGAIMFIRFLERR
ncbi:MAG: flippase [Actinobacteria bacterium]|nr:flippase [Actinomycetota bacterium]